MILTVIVYIILGLGAVGIVFTLIEWTTGKTLKAVPEEPKPEAEAPTVDTSAIDAYFGSSPQSEPPKRKTRKVMKWVPKSGRGCDPIVWFWAATH